MHRFFCRPVSSTPSSSFVRKLNSTVSTITSVTSRRFTSSSPSPVSAAATDSSNMHEPPLSKNQEKKLLKKKQQEQQQKESAKIINETKQNTQQQQQQNFVYPSFVVNSNAKSFLHDNFEIDPETQRRNKVISTKTSTNNNDNNNNIFKLGGRVTAVRDMGKVVFLTLKSDDQILQVMYSVDESLGVTKDQVKEISKQIKMGDIVGVEGRPGVSKKGEPSLVASKIQPLSKYAAVQEANCPSLTGYVKPSDPDILYRYRFVDLMANSASQQVFRTRAKVLSSMRKFLDDRGFVEVETPVFHTVPSGAAARPFRTFHESNDSDLFLRVAPELYLKQCVVGGLERVYEIGRVFRNEYTDRSHNPEFTSCEFYQAYATYRELMPMTEEMIRTICFDALGTTKILVAVDKQPCDQDPKTSNAKTSLEKVEEEISKEIREEMLKEKQQILPDENMLQTSEQKSQQQQQQQQQNQEQHWREIDFAKPFKVIHIIPELESHLGLEFPRPISQLDSEEGSFFLKQLLSLHDIPLPQPASPAKLFDKLIDHFITDRVVDPAFVVGHPTFMSPLAKEDPDQPGVSERFELFVNGMEICNSYSELNDPMEQKHRFEQQLKQRVFFKDEEAQCVDETFLKALQVGLPPTAGWGMGIDRMVMLLCRCSSIRDVILFPLLRSTADSRDSKRKRESASFFGFDPFMTKFCLNSLEAEFIKKDHTAAGLVRNVHRALDSICMMGSSTTSASFNNVQNNNDNNNNDKFGTSRSLCEILSSTAMNAFADSPSSSTAMTKGGSRSGIVVDDGNNNNNKIQKKEEADCGVLALIVLGGLRESLYVVQEKAERMLLAAALKALCDPSVASNWWWRK